VPNQDKDEAFCEICQSEASEAPDPIVFCEGCELAVHQNCFGIKTLPKKDWYCRVCTTFGAKTDVRCRFCPLSWGTMKQTGDGGWGHFACSVWQQSLRFEDLTTFEPITHEWNLNTESFTKM
jgi:NuA3 HAT complex component NTO1